MLDFTLIESEEDLRRNVNEFNKHIIQARKEVITGKYFIHLKSDSEDKFAPSKFSYLKDISIERYLEDRKYERIDGGDAQKHIKKITNKEWTPFNELTSSEQESFIDWIRPFPKRRKNLEKTCFITIFDKGSFFPEELNDESGIPEGAKRKITVNKYERSSIARNKCIETHGYLCKICQFDFEKVYGEIGKEFIHVHHIIPLYTVDENYKVDPENHLIPVCPNCHAMLHRRNGNCLKDEELKQMINKENLVAWASNFE